MAGQMIDSFVADGDDGRKYTVHVYAEIADAATRGDPGGTAAGQRWLQTSDGLTVNRLEKGVYQVVQTGVILRSTATNAP